jgi:hypothetical protein
MAFLRLMSLHMGPPLSKFVHPTTKSVVLGWSLDTMALTIGIDDARRDRCLCTLRHAVALRVIPSEVLQSILGVLFFLTRVVRWGKTFLSRLYRLSGKAARRRTPLRLRKWHRYELGWWLATLPHVRDIPMVHHSDWSRGFDLETDACETGFGFYQDGRWGCGTFTACERLLAVKAGMVKSSLPLKACDDAFSRRRSMPFCELFAIVKACSALRHLWRGRAITVATDCIPARDILNNRYASNPYSSALLKSIAFMAVDSGFDIRARYLPGKHQYRADPLSRGDIRMFFSQAPSAIALSCTTPPAPHLYWPGQLSY